MSIIKTITLEKRRNPVMASSETFASVEFNQDRFTVALAEGAEHYYGRQRPDYEDHHRRYQIEQVSRQITSGIQREISEALGRLDAVIRNGESVTLRVAR